MDSSALPRRKRTLAGQVEQLVAPVDTVPTLAHPTLDVADMIGFSLPEVAVKPKGRSANKADDVDPRHNAIMKTLQKAAKRTKDQIKFNPSSSAAYNLGIPLPSLALSWAIGSNVLPFRVIHLAGKRGSFKTAFMAEMFRWVLELAESTGYAPIDNAIRYLQNESKPAWDYIWSFLDNRDDYTGKIKPFDSITADEWFYELLDCEAEWVSYFNTALDGEPFWFTPLAVGLDSLVGTLPEKVSDKIRKERNIDLGFPLLAKNITALAGVLPRLMGRRPILFIATNHLKDDLDASVPGMEHTPGGRAWQHAESLELRFKQGTLTETTKATTMPVTIKVEKSCFGDTKRAITVPVVWTRDTHPETGNLRQWSMWDWPVATIDLLTKVIPAKSPATHARVQKILDLNIDSRSRVWSNVLGISEDAKLSKHEAGLVLEQSPELLDQLLPAMGVRRGRFFKPGTNFIEEQMAERPASLMSERIYRRPAASNLAAYLGTDESEDGEDGRAEEAEET